MSDLGELLRTARKRARLTQEALAGRVGVDDSYISKMEKGVDRSPTREVALKLADAFGMPNRPLILYVSTKDTAALERFTLLLEANVAGAEDVQEIRLVDLENSEELGGEEQASSSPLRQSDSDLLAATGTFESPGSLVDNQAQQLPAFEEQVRQKLASFHLPYAKRMIAQQMILEAIGIIGWGLKEAE